MRVSILIPLAAPGRYLSQTLNSLLRQTFDDFEVYVVCAPGVSGHLPEDDRFTVLESRAISLGHLVDDGLQAASGAYFTVLDPWDLLDPFRLELQVAALAQRPDADAVHSDARLIDAFNRAVEVRGQETAESIVSSSVLARRKLYEANRELLVRQDLMSMAEFWLQLNQENSFLKLPLKLVHRRSLAPVACKGSPEAVTTTPARSGRTRR